MREENLGTLSHILKKANPIRKSMMQFLYNIPSMMEY